MSGKNKVAAEESGAVLSSGSTASVPSTSGGSSVKKCALDQKHWVGVQVVDESGNPVKDVTVHIKLPDASEIDVNFQSARLQKDGSFQTKKNLDAGNCEFSFPALFDAEWWPSGGTARNLPAAGTATAGDGDCVQRVADTLGFRDYKTIWTATANNALKTTRPNPNMLVSADVLNTRNQQVATETKAVDQTWVFVVKDRQKASLMIVLIDQDGNPLANRPWTITGVTKAKGKTGANGLIEVKELNLQKTVGVLQVDVKDAVKAPKSPATSPPAKADPPPYPAPVVPKDFKDKDPDADYTKRTVEWTLSIGSLGPVKTDPGALTRLHNLGFECQADSEAKIITRSVKAYQRFYLKNKNGSGVAADVQDDAGTRHDNP